MKLTAGMLCVSLLGFSGQLKAAEYAVLLKTLSNPFWQKMKEGIDGNEIFITLKLTVIMGREPWF
jgi:ABC-type sugar transport system substrate-binding protein